MRFESASNDTVIVTFDRTEEVSVVTAAFDEYGSHKIKVEGATQVFDEECEWHIASDSSFMVYSGASVTPLLEMLDHYDRITEESVDKILDDEADCHRLVKAEHRYRLGHETMALTEVVAYAAGVEG